MKKLTLFSAIIFCIITNFSLSAKNPVKPEKKDYEVLLEAQEKFDLLDYGGALNKALEAKEIRQQLCKWQLFILDKELSPAAVRTKGDYIPDIVSILQSRNAKDAVEIINSFIDKKSLDFFEGSVKKLVSYVELLKVYPEADFLCGKVYQFEGEYDVAMQFFDAAIKNAEFLDVYAEKYDILYQMADIAYQTGKKTDYEKYLLLILSDDEKYYKNSVFYNAIIRTISSNEDKDPLNKFFMLYRAETKFYLKAYQLIAEYYKENAQGQKALVADAMAVLSSFTSIYSAIKIRDPEYNYTTLQDFFVTLTKWHDIELWLIDHDVWKSFTEFALLCRRSGYVTFATQMLEAIKESCNEPYWKKRAENLLN